MTIISEASRDGRCPCGAEPRPGNPFCSADCEPDLVRDPNDPWSFVTVVSTAQLHRHDPCDPWSWQA